MDKTLRVLILRRTILIHKQKCLGIFGKFVTKNTRWLSGDALTLKKRIAKRLDILDRTRDDTADRLQDTLADRAIEDDKYECHSCCEGHSMLFQLLPSWQQS